MGRIRRKHSSEFKARVVLELLRGRSMSAVCSEYRIHPNLAQNWKRQAISNIQDLFAKKSKSNDDRKDNLIGELYKQIGKLKVEIDWLKKKHEELGI